MNIFIIYVYSIYFIPLLFIYLNVKIRIYIGYLYRILSIIEYLQDSNSGLFVL